MGLQKRQSWANEYVKHPPALPPWHSTATFTLVKKVHCS